MSCVGVKLHIYDLSRGLAKSMSQAFLGKQLDGIWHTGIVVYGKEFFYGGAGIQSCAPGTTILGAPDTIHDVGTTDLPWDLFAEYLDGLADESYNEKNYNLLSHNCNQFTNEVAQFLTGQAIPSYILDLPGEVLDTPFGAMVGPIIDSLSKMAEPSPPTRASNSPSPPPNLQRQSSASKGAKDAGNVPNVAREEEQQPSVPEGEPQTTAENSSVAQPVPASGTGEEVSSSNASQAAAMQSSTAVGSTVPPQPKSVPDPSGRVSPIGTLPVDAMYEPLYGEAVFFTDVNVTQHYCAVKTGAMKIFTEEELHLLDELHEFLSTEDCIWSVTNEHMQLIGKILHSELPPAVHIDLIKLLQPAVMNLDIVLMLKGDKNKAFMAFVFDFEKIDKEIQVEIIKMMCNMCNCKSGVNWLMSIIDWDLGSRQVTNSQLVIKAIVTSLLADYEPLVEASANLALHISRYQMSYYEDIIVELSFALLQTLNSELPEQTAYYALAALVGFFHMSREMPGIVVSVGVNLKPHCTKSDRCAVLVKKIEATLPIF